RTSSGYFLGTRSIDVFLDIYPSIDSFIKKRSEYTEGHLPRNIPKDTFPRNIPRDMFLGIYRGTRSSEYTEAHVPRNIPRKMFLGNIPTKFSLGIFRGDFRQISDPRKFVSSEFRRKIPRDFRGKKKFRGIISENLFRRYVVGITLFRRNSDDFFPQYPCCFLVVLILLNS
uniref:Uncharacterized protein n=1 Tax=Brassica oleracea var. oleracea TaxID=109376 RepID=A0A0D3BBL0_BRAOL